MAKISTFLGVGGHNMAQMAKLTCTLQGSRAAAGEVNWGAGFPYSERTGFAPMRGFALVGVLFGLVFVGTALGQAPDDAKPSSYAPADDLIRQVKMYVESMSAATADSSEYNDDKQGEVFRDANTLAAIALVLGMHDQDNALKPVAGKLITAAEHLAAEHDDPQKAIEAVKAIKLIVDKPEKGKPVEWKAVGEMVPLMKQVPIVNNNLRRGVTGRRFAQSSDKNAALAATLAAIAQASMLDTNHIADEADRPLWIKTCAEMRDGSAEALTAIRKGDQAAATKALDKIVKSCDDCHHKFRD